MVRKVTTSGIIEQFVNDYSKKYYLRELAFVLKKPHQTIKPYVEELVKNKILIKNQRTNILEYSLNFKNKLVYDYLIIAEKERLITRLNEDSVLRVLYEKLSCFFEKNIFIIFGSSVTGIKSDSDIDLLTIGKLEINKVVEEFEEVYNKKIHKVQVSKLDNLDNVLIKEIYKKHLIFNNTEEVIKFFRWLYEKNKLV